MGEIFTNSIKMVRELVYCMDNLCRKLNSRPFQFVVSVPLGTDFWPFKLTLRWALVLVSVFLVKMRAG